MPRSKSLSDEAVLESALTLMRERGPDALSFGTLARATGLSGATLVQRFGTKPGLIKAATSHAWDRLDRATSEAIASAPDGTEGVVALLVALSGYGDIETYADNLLILREDLRDPDLRARGRAWHAVLVEAISARLPDRGDALATIVLDQWQGSLLWWSFDPDAKVEHHVECRLRSLLALVVGT
jgi:AcrR family transcriptional regulator